MFLTQAELVDMVFIIGQCHRNALLAARVYKQRYPDRRHPRKKSFEDLMQRFINTGSVQFTKRRRRRTVITEENEFFVLASVQENPNVSTREISNAADNVSARSVSRILHKHKYHPYKIQMHQELLPADFLKREEFCRWAIEKINENENFFNNVLFTDEATFHKNGFVNRHNFHYYNTENPHEFRATQSQFRWSLNVWGGVFGDRIFGPVFFDVPLNGRSYVDFLQNQLMEYLDDVPLAIRDRMWIQQDGAPPHSVREAQNFLNAQFPNKWIGRRGPINWPARSPDLTKCDFFLWGFIKDKVYLSSPTTQDDMRDRIVRAFNSVTPQVLAQVDEHFKKRVRACVQQNGRHFEHLL